MLAAVAVVVAAVVVTIGADGRTPHCPLVNEDDNDALGVIVVVVAAPFV